MTEIARELLRWYDAHRRAMPWRGARDPYRVWVSEIMLQQTRVETVVPYYERFMARFPDAAALAAADEPTLLKAWEGLGYYSRARNLQKAARVLMERYGGQLPASEEALLALPGVGPYTAGAVASIAFGLPVPAIDGNVIRVVSRLCRVREDARGAAGARLIREAAREMLPADRPGDFNQAMMDLGATVCAAGTPDCDVCPLNALCEARAAGDAAELPVLAQAKPPREIDVGVVLLTLGDAVLVMPREERLLHGLTVFLLLEGAHGRDGIARSLAERGIRAVFAEDFGEARHVFTHRVWRMEILRFAVERAEDAGELPTGARFVRADALDALAFPTAMKAAKAAVKAWAGSLHGA